MARLARPSLRQLRKALHSGILVLPPPPQAEDWNQRGANEFTQLTAAAIIFIVSEHNTVTDVSPIIPPSATAGSAPCWLCFLLDSGPITVGTDSSSIETFLPGNE